MIVRVKKMRVIVIRTVIVKAHWFVGKIIVHLNPIFLISRTIVVRRSAQVIVPVKKMRVIVMLTVIVKADWFVGLIIVHLVFLTLDMIVV